MNRFMRLISVLALSTFLVAAAPLSVGAQAQTETVTILVDFTTPAGTQITGTVVGVRQCSDSTLTDLTFSGMVNGQLANASASVVEHWAGNSSARFDRIEIREWRVGLERPGATELLLVQTAPGLLSVNGVPVAVDGELVAPCGGRTSYTLTNPGRGTQDIVLLPATGGGSLLSDPLVIVMLMVSPGIVLVLLSGLVRKLGERREANSDL